MDRELWSNYKELATAIGEVAIASASSDDRLRIVLHEIAGPPPHPTWILFQGQSTSWLLNSSRDLLEEADPHSRVWPEALRQELKSAWEGVQAHVQHRHAVIHGTWHPRDVLWDDDDVQPRPWGADVDDGIDEPVWACHRSRYSKFGPYQLWTASDVDLLADFISNASIGVMRAYAKMHKHRYPSEILDSMWAEYL